jgi:hypothetical protein
MLRFSIVLAFALNGASATAMPVSTYMQKTSALKAKGPLAVFSGDINLLKRQVQQDGDQLRAENKALAAQGKLKHYCAPEGSAITLKDLMAAVEAVPVSERARTSTKDAFRDYIARRYPCRD